MDTGLLEMGHTTSHKYKRTLDFIQQKIPVIAGIFLLAMACALSYVLLSYVLLSYILKQGHLPIILYRSVWLLRDFGE